MIPDDDEGMTLIELLIAMMITVIIVGVIAASLILGLKSTKAASDHLLESKDAQAISAYLPSDLLSVQPSGIEVLPGTASGCLDAPPEPYNVARLTWSETSATGTTWFRAAYRVVQNGIDWQLVRFSCQAPTEVGLTAAATIRKTLVQGLQPATSGLPTATPAGDRLTVRVTDASGYSFALTGTRRTAATPGPSSSTTPPPSATPEVRTAAMYDDNGSGYVDRVLVTFSASLPGGCTGSMFSLTSAPSGGQVGSVGISADRVTININEGTGAPDTGIGGFHVRFLPTSACDALSFDGPPDDLASPVLTTFASGAAGATNPTAGKAEPGDSFVLNFSEKVVGVPTSSAVVLDHKTGSNPPNTLLLTGIGTLAQSLGSTNYQSGNKAANFPGTVASNAAGTVWTVTLGVCDISSISNQTGCSNITTGSAGTTTPLTPAATIKDSAGNLAKPLTTNPVPTGSVRVF